MEKQIVKLRSVTKYKENPFIGDVLTIKRGKTTVIAGSTSKVLTDVNTGETEGITLLHKYKEVDREQFIKLYIGEVKRLFELSKTGLRAFGYITSCAKINDAEIYLNIQELMEYCGYSENSKMMAYKGLGELILNKIIAPSTKPNIWFINPNVIFNGDRIAFIREYRLKTKKELPKQGSLSFPPPAPEGERV